MQSAFLEMLAELRRLEWLQDEEDDVAYRYCPSCESIHPDDGGMGHLPGCTLAATIAKATGEPTP